MDKEKIILPDPADIAPDNREIPSLDFHSTGKN